MSTLKPIPPQGRVDRSDAADTVRNAVGVLDKNGTVQRVAASGTKILMQKIDGETDKLGTLLCR